MIGGGEEEEEGQGKQLPQQQQQQQQGEDAVSNKDAAALPISRALKVSPASAPTVVALAAAEESPLKQQEEKKEGRQPLQCKEGTAENVEDAEENDEKDNVEQPKSPKNGLALTEYTARPSRLSADMTKSKAAALLPKDYLLPDGYPDVRNPLQYLLYFFFLLLISFILFSY
jgi:hypothetical protein